MGNKIVIGIAALLLALPVLFAGGFGEVVGSLLGRGHVSCAPDGEPTGTVPGYGPDQMANAATITAVGKQRQVPEQGWVVAIAVAIQESTLRNLDHGDRDSLGLFQQRPSQGWGTPEQIMDPTYAATQFYLHLQAVPGWQDMSLNDAAQTVQRSGTPNAYGQHEKTAQAIVAAVSGVSCTTTVSAGDCDNIIAPNPAAMTAINYACGQRGLPYVWGGNGPELTELPNGQTQVSGGFDCSGLTKAAYAAAGIEIPRTAQTQYHAGPRVPAGQPILPGDLVFFGTSTGHITHVGLALSSDTMVNAPDIGIPVRVDGIRKALAATRPAGP